MTYEHWLTTIGKSPKTAKNYSGAIAGGLSIWAAKAGLVNQSLYEFDPLSGLSLPNLDKVFDPGYISFEESGRIWISNELEDADMLGVHAGLCVKLEEKHQGYLAYHRDVVFRH